MSGKSMLEQAQQALTALGSGPYRAPAHVVPAVEPLQYHLFYQGDTRSEDNEYIPHVVHVEFETFEQMHDFINKNAAEWFRDGIVPHYVNGPCQRIELKQEVKYEAVLKP